MMLLYKYTRPGLIDAFLVRETLAFPLYNQLNDPFESTAHIPAPQTVHESRFGQRRMLDFRSDYDSPDDLNLFPHGETLSHSELDRRLAGNAGNWLNAMRSSAGIVSLTTDPLNVLMWSHYAENHRGVCFGFDKKLFESNIQNDGSWPADLRNHIQDAMPVRYADVRPKLQRSERDLLISAFFTKHSCWSYEEEWRLLRNVESEGSDPISLRPLPIIALREVTVGLNATANTFELARDACRRHPEVNLFQVFQPEDQYAIGRKRVDC